MHIYTIVVSSPDGQESFKKWVKAWHYQANDGREYAPILTEARLYDIKMQPEKSDDFIADLRVLDQKKQDAFMNSSIVDMIPKLLGLDPIDRSKAVKDRPIIRDDWAYVFILGTRKDNKWNGEDII